MLKSLRKHGKTLKDNPSSPSQFFIREKEFKARVRRTRNLLAKQGIDLLICFSLYPEREGNLEYLVNYHGAFPPSQSDSVYSGLGYSALAISSSDGPVLFPGLLFASGNHVGIERVISSENLVLAISDFISGKFSGERRRIRGTVGIAGVDLVPSLYTRELEQKFPTLKFVNADRILLDQRMVKSKGEQEMLREGARIADAGIQAAFDATKPGVRESEIGVAAMKACYNEGADYVVRTRIYGASISGVRWPILTNRKVSSKEVTGIDLVGWYGSYGFDVLRRWVVGAPSAKQRDLLEKAKTMTEETWKRTKEGMTGNEISELSISLSKELGIEMGEVRPFGHAIGLEIVENPFLLPRSKGIISEGMVLCVEPGIESREFGSVHFEDEVLISGHEAHVISKCPKILN